MSDVQTWSSTAASNNSAAPNGFPEGMPPSGVNDAAREVMAAVARYRADTDGVNTSSGTDTITLAASRTMTAYAQGDMFTFKAGGTNSGATTLNVDALGAKDIYFNGSPLIANQIVSGRIYTVVYDGTRFQILNVSFFSTLSAESYVRVGDPDAEYSQLRPYGLYIAGGTGEYGAFYAGNFSIDVNTGDAKIEGTVDDTLDTALLSITGNNDGITSTTPNNIIAFYDTDAPSADQPLGKIEFYDKNGFGDTRLRSYILARSLGTSSGAFLSFAVSGLGSGTVVAEVAKISSTGLTVTSASAGLGYGTGSGGTVTQATSRTTGVTIDKPNGAITLVSAAGSTTIQSFTVTNSTVAATDTVIVNQKSGTDLYRIYVTAVAAGSFRISYATLSGTTTEQPVFNFAVIKAVAA